MYDIKIQYKDRMEEGFTHYTIFGISYMIQARGFIDILMNFIHSKYISRL